MKPASQGGVSELYIVYTEFINMVVQKVRVLRMLPVEVVEAKVESGPGMSRESEGDNAASSKVRPLYRFEPSLDEGDGCHPAEVHPVAYSTNACWTAAASETASRQNAMHTATENAA